MVIGYDEPYGVELCNLYYFISRLHIYDMRASLRDLGQHTRYDFDMNRVTDSNEGEQLAVTTDDDDDILMTTGTMGIGTFCDNRTERD